jgi:RHS repeat-associated protein
MSQVNSGGLAGAQTVTYTYGWVDNYYLVLTAATYQHEPTWQQTTSASYNYGTCYGEGSEPCSGSDRSPLPLLKYADDPHYAGPMTKIGYNYSNLSCPPPVMNPLLYPDYFGAQPYSIAAEKAPTGIAVSTFALDCYAGTRREDNGLGGSRTFSFGTSANTFESAPPPEGPFFCRSYQLGKITDFSTPSSTPVPFEKQNYSFDQPRRIWDGRGLVTEAVANGQDDSGEPAQVHHIDGSAHYYDRVNPGSSEPLDTMRMHNTYNHWLFSQTDERNLPTIYTRDSRRRVKRIDYRGGSAELFEYNDWNQVTSHTLPSGAVVTYVYDASTHRLTSEYNSVDGPDARKDYTYDSLERVSTVADGHSRGAGKDFSTRMTYNGCHRVLTVEYAGTINGPNPTTSYGYDGYGNCTAVTDELGHTTVSTYDQYRRCTSYTEPLNAHNWNGSDIVASRTWDWIYDRWIDGVGQRDQSSHTANEWRIQIEPAFNAGGDRPMTARTHDVNNRVVAESTGWIQPTGAIGNWYWGPDGENHYFSYDENGQKKSFRDSQGRLTTYDYDLRNRLWKTNETVETVPRTTETLYDVTGNKTVVTFPDLRSQQWLDYDAFGQAGRFIDERGNTTNLSYVWGPMKKLLSVTTHRLRDDGGTEDQPTIFSYDFMGRARQIEFPDHSTETSSYEFGQLKTWKTRKNQTKTIVYDARGREQSHSWNDGVTPTISRSWDAANRLRSITNIWSSIDFAYDDAGQVLWEGEEIAGSGGRTQTNYYRYPNGSVAHLHYPGGTWLRNDYTSRGQLAATGWDDDETSTWWRKLAAYTYLPDGKVDHIDHGNGTRTGIGYDQRGMINYLHTFKVNLGIELVGQNYWRDTRDRITAMAKQDTGRGDRFRYDDEGQLVEAWYNATDPAHSGAGNTRYDGFAYDALGNRTQNNYVASRGLTSFVRRDNGLNQYSSWTPSIIFHDDNYPGSGPLGNGVTMAEGWITASYNALNQPVVIWSPTYSGTSNFMWFGYDPLGRCVKRWLGSSGDVYSNPATYFHYDGWNLLQEGANAWGPARVYVHGNRVDEIVWSYNTSTGGQAYHHYEARGHCTLLTDSAGAILEQYEYDAFGWPYFYAANGDSIGSYDAQERWAGYSLFGNRFLFTGREWLSDLKLYDYRNRMYQPELGRFLQPDPKDFAAGDYNLYRYCHNDPVNKSDPTGLDTYQQNRDFDGLGGGVFYQSNFNIGTHSFTFTTNPDGSIAHTYSWGNTGNDRGWHMDHSVDRKAAEQAMTLPCFLQNKVGDSTLDPYIQKAFDQLNKKENEHQNLGVARNCKWEATNLLHLAKQLQKQDQEAREREKQKPKLHPTEVGTYKPAP